MSNLREYFDYEKKYKDKEITPGYHVIDVDDISTFPRPNTPVNVKCKLAGTMENVVVGTTGFTWIWVTEENFGNRQIFNGDEYTYEVNSEKER